MHTQQQQQQGDYSVLTHEAFGEELNRLEDIDTLPTQLSNHKQNYNGVGGGGGGGDDKHALHHHHSPHDKHGQHNKSEHSWITRYEASHYYSINRPLYYLLVIHDFVRRNIVKQKYFDVIILICIVANCIILAMQHPGQSHASTYEEVLITLDTIFTWIFIAEMVLKIIGLTFVQHYRIIEEGTVLEDEKENHKALKDHTDMKKTAHHDDIDHQKNEPTSNEQILTRVNTASHTIDALNIEMTGLIAVKSLSDPTAVAVTTTKGNNSDATSSGAVIVSSSSTGSNNPTTPPGEEKEKIHNNTQSPNKETNISKLAEQSPNHDEVQMDDEELSQTNAPNTDVTTNAQEESQSSTHTNLQDDCKKPKITVQDLKQIAIQSGQMPLVPHKNSISRLLETHLTKKTATPTSHDEKTNMPDHATSEPKIHAKETYGGYFTDKWNWLDFVIILSAVLALYVDSSDAFKGFRALRVLRPLRNLSIIPQLREIAAVFVKILPELGKIALLLLFVLTFFGVAGVQLYHGRLRMRCFSYGYTDPETGEYIPVNEHTHVDHLSEEIQHMITSGVYCKVEDNKCEKFTHGEYPQCLAIHPNPDGGMTNYDTIYAALFQAFVMSTLDIRQVTGWLQDTFSSYAWIYSFALLFILGFFALNLILAVICEEFAREQVNPRENPTLELIIRVRHHLRCKFEESRRLLFQQQLSQAEEDDQMMAKRTDTMKQQVTIIEENEADLHDEEEAEAEEVVFGTAIGQGGSLHSSDNPEDGAKQKDTDLAALQFKKEDVNTQTQAEPDSPNDDDDLIDLIVVTSLHDKIVEDAKVDLHWIEKGKTEDEKAFKSLLAERETHKAFKKLIQRTQHRKQHGIALFEDYLHTYSDTFGIGDKYFVNVSEKEKHKKAILDEIQRRMDRVVVKLVLRDTKAKPDTYLVGKNGFVKWCNWIVVNEFFSSFILVTIVMNALSLSVTWPTMPDRLRHSMDFVNNLCTVVFIVEFILKHIGLGPVAYWSEAWTRFDGTIVVISIIELGVQIFLRTQGEDLHGVTALRAFRVFRVLRVLRVATQTDRMRKLMDGVLRSIASVLWLLVLFFLMVFIFGLLGFNLFAHKHESEEVRSNFNTMWYSCLAVLQTVTFDKYREIIHALRHHSHDAGGAIIVALYFVTCAGIGNFLMVNMIIAVLLSSMNEVVNSDWDNYRYLLPKAQYIQLEHPYWTEKEYQMFLFHELKLRRQRRAWQTHLAVWNKHRNKQQLMGISLGIFSQKSKIRQYAYNIVQHRMCALFINMLIFFSCILLALDSNTLEHGSKLYLFIEACNIVFAVIFAIEMILKFIALGIVRYPFFSKRNYHYVTLERDLHKWKILCRQQFEKTHKLHPLYQHINQYRTGGIYDCVQCVKKKAAGPNVSDEIYYIAHYMFPQQKLNIRFLFVKEDENRYRYKGSYFMNETDHRQWTAYEHNGVSHRCDWDEELHQVCTSVLLNDANTNAYFTSNWNRLDAFVVFITLLSLIFPTITFLRGLRAIRPLRIAARNPRIKIVLSTLMGAIIPATSSILFAFLFMLILAIVGVQLFSGRMHYCTNLEDGLEYYLVPEDIRYGFDEASCQPTEEYPHLKWVPFSFNFDNILNGFVSVFILSAWDGWNVIMWRAIDVTEMGEAPKHDNHPEYGIFFVLALIIGGFFSLRLIVSVILEEFKTQKRFHEGHLFRSQAQTDWVRTQHLMLKFKLQNQAKPPLNKFRAQCFYLANHRYEAAHRFDWFILICVILNTIQMSMKHYNQSSAFDTLEVVADLVFVAIFTAEAIIRIVGLGWKAYWRSNWNKLDFLILLASYPGLIFACFPYLASGFDGVQAQMIRTFRIARILRLLTTVKTLNFLARMFLFALPSLWNIAVTVFIIFYIFSIIGVNLFGDVETGLKRYNFRDFPHAIYTLVLSSTAESWWILVARCMEHSNRYTAIIYWLLFFLMCGLVSMNLFIGVILETFSENLRIEREHRFQLMSVRKLAKAWNDEDTRGTGLLPVSKFWRLLLRTPYPCGFTQPLPTDEAELNEDVYQRFITIIRSGVYKEPSMIEAREHVARIKLICQKGKKIGIGRNAEYRLLSEEEEDIYSIGNKILNFFVNLCNEDEHPTETSSRNLNVADKTNDETKLQDLTVGTNENAKSESNVMESESGGIWLVNFQDAILALCTTITGPEISVRVSDKRYEMMFVDWWDKYEAENFAKNVAGNEGALGAESMISFVDQLLDAKI